MVQQNAGHLGPPNLSASDGAILAAVIANLRGGIDANWDAVVSACGFKNVGVARTRFNQVKKKLNLSAGGGHSGNNAAAGGGYGDDLFTSPAPKPAPKLRATPKTGSKRKRAVKVEDDDVEDGKTGLTTPPNKILDESSILEETPQTPAKHSAKKVKKETPELHPAFAVRVPRFAFSGDQDDEPDQGDMSQAFSGPIWNP